MSDQRAFTARLPVDHYRAVRALAYFTGRTLTDVLAEAVRDFLLADGRPEVLEELERFGRDVRASVNALAAEQRP